jgi:hypothetical protein
MVGHRRAHAIGVGGEEIEAQHRTFDELTRRRRVLELGADG